MSEFLNLRDAFYDGVGKYDIPEVYPVHDLDIERWKTFNYAMNTKLPPKTGITFFLWDHQFERVWNFPNRYVDVLKKFDAVLQPDFSTYIDFPLAVQIFNKYRNHWLARYWSDRGIKVVPQIEWGLEDTFDWCFDGYPQDSIVAVSNVGCMNKKEWRDAFMNGYNEMLKRLKPRKILMFAHTMDNYEGNVVHIPYDFSIEDNVEKEKPFMPLLEGFVF